MKSLKTVACFHTSSSSLPSMTGGLSKRATRKGTAFSAGMVTLCVVSDFSVCAAAGTTAQNRMRISRSDFVISTIRELSRSRERSLTEALADEIGHFNEECPAVAPEARFKLSGERAVAVARQVVVVPEVERRT